MQDTISDGTSVESVEGAVEKVRCFIARVDARDAASSAMMI